jgi:hypothetical protein
MVESLAELADLHDDVEIVVVELLHHARVRGAVVPTEKSIWHAQCELNGVEHRLALSRRAPGGITPTRSIAAGLDLTEHAKAVRLLPH